MVSLKNLLPQDSNLSSLLFLTFINDFHISVSSGALQQFADDTVIMCRSKSFRKVRSLMSRGIIKLTDLL